MWKKVLLAGIGMASFALAEAGTVSLQPVTTDIQVGSLVRIDVAIDFPNDPTLGGGFNISWDSGMLAFADFTFDNATAFGDPAFQQLGVLSPGLYADVLNGDIATPETSGIVGSIFFTALQSGVAVVGLGESLNPLLIWANGDFQQQFPTFIGTNLSIHPVPVPAAFALFLGAIAGLGFVSRLDLADAAPA